MDLYEKRSGSRESYNKIDELDAIIANLSLSDLNRVLYRADPEEQDDGNGGGVYVLPDTGPLVYCGLQGQFRHFISKALLNPGEYNLLGRVVQNPIKLTQD